MPSRPIAIYLRTADGSLVQFDSVRRLRRWFRDGRIQGQDLISVDGITWLGAHDEELTRILGDLEGDSGERMPTVDSRPTYHSIARQVRFDTRPRLERHRPAVDKRPTQPEMPAVVKEKEEAWFEHGESGLLSRQIFLQAKAQRARRNSRVIAFASFVLIGAAITLVVLWELDRRGQRSRLGVIESTPMADVAPKPAASAVIEPTPGQPEPAHDPALVGGPSTPVPPSPQERVGLANEMAVAAAVAELSAGPRLAAEVQPNIEAGDPTPEASDQPGTVPAAPAVGGTGESTTDAAPSPAPALPAAAGTTAAVGSPTPAAQPGAAPAKSVTPKPTAPPSPAPTSNAPTSNAPTSNAPGRTDHEATPPKANPTTPAPAARPAPAPASGLGDLSRFDMDALMRLGHQSTRKGRHDRAVSIYSEALTRKPGRVEVHYERAMALLRLGSASRAHAAFQRCTQLSAAYAPCRYGSARALEAMGRTSDAISAYRAYLSRYPTSSQASAVERRLERLGAH